MKKKKIISLLLTCSIVFCTTFLTGCKKEVETKPTKEQIIIGSVTDIDANMMDGWTNGATNSGIRTLMFGYEPITYTKEGQFEVDKQVAKDFKETENPDKTKTITITLQDDLKWNNGEKITASDYLFSLMLHASPEYASLEASDTSTFANCFVGYEDFHNAKSKTFKGLKLIDEKTFSFTIKAEELPFHFDIAYANFSPYPISTIAPNVKITSDDKGATISDNFNKELLQKTISDTKTGYRYNPKVTCGAYNFDGFDTTSKQVVMTKNDHFKGTYDSVKPSIKKIILRKVNTETAIDELRAGTIDLFSNVSGGTEINAGLDVVEEGKAVAKSYLRAGYGKIQFSCDFGPTKFPAVRQAIAHCLDRDEFAKQYSGGFAKVVDGLYGLSQWEYEENKSELSSKLNHYSYSIEKAKEILVADGWNLDKNGGAYVSGLRYKKVDGKLMPLEINWANSPNNPVSDLISTMLPDAMLKAGMKLNPTTLEWGVLLNNIYRQGIEKPQYNMFNLATGFVPIPSYWYEYSRQQKYMGNYNDHFIKDEQLEKITSEMKKVPSSDKDGWSKKWLELQIRWNELMPSIPLYSDEYHDFFIPQLKNYDPDGLWQWQDAIVYASLS